MERRHDHKKGSGLTRIHRVKARVVERGRRERRGGEARRKRDPEKRDREQRRRESFYVSETSFYGLISTGGHLL